MLSTSSSTSTHVNEISSFNGGIEELQHQSLPRSTSLGARSVTELKIYGASILCLHAIRHKVKNFFKHFLNYGINSISRFLSASDNHPRQAIDLIFFGWKNIYEAFLRKDAGWKITLHNNRAENVPAFSWEKFISSIFNDAQLLWSFWNARYKKFSRCCTKADLSLR